MSCVPKHILEELGVSRRKLGHHVMGKEETMTRSFSSRNPEGFGPDFPEPSELDRLRAVNAKLLEALAHINTAPTSETFVLRTLARDAIDEANK